MNAFLADDIIRERKPLPQMTTIPLAASNWDEAEESAIRRVIASGRYTMGPEVKRFERQFAQHVDKRFAVMVNSGSSANLLMIAALHFTKWLPRNSTVAVPAVSWSTTYAPLIQYGMRIPLIDVDDSLNIDPKQIKDCDLLFAVNLLGNPCDFDRFPKQMPQIVDNCESQGCYHHGREGGSYGMMASYSFFFSHHLQTTPQATATTWDEEREKWGWPDFSPPCQDEFFVARFIYRKALPAIMAGRFDEACHLCRLEWTSLPGGQEQNAATASARATYVK